MATAALVACGGGGGGAETAAVSDTTGASVPAGSGGTATPPVAPTTTTTTTTTTTPPVANTTPVSTGAAVAAGVAVTGTAAFGAPLEGAQVSVMDANGITRRATANANGSYSISVAGLALPLLMTANGRSGDAALTYHALVATAPQAGGVVNITPLTDAIVALVSSDGSSPAEFADAARLRALDGNKLQQAAQAVKAALRNVAAAVGDANFDPLTSAFVADRSSAGDKLLDAVKVTLHEGGVTLRNALVPLAANDAGAAATSTTLTAASTATTAGAAALPAPVLADKLSMFDAFITDANDCLALPAAQRVAVDGVGTPTGFLGACAVVDGFSASYKRNGQNLLAYWGHQLRNVLPDGARLGTPEVLGLVKNANGEDLATVRLPFTSPQGAGSYVESARRLASGEWAIEGNQRNFDAGVSVRVLRASDASSSGHVPTSGPDKGRNVGRLSAYSTRLYLHFNPAGPNGKGVYAVRVKGPGLPAAGVVLARSSSCGTGDYLAFYSNNGSLPATPAVGATLPMPTASTANSWALRVAPFGGGYQGTDFFNELRGRNADGTASSAVGNNVSPTPVDLAQVPMLSRYVFEVFKAGSNVAAETFAVRTVARPVAPEFADKQLWAELSADAKGYANPADSVKAAALDSATLSWTLPAGAAPVNGGSVWGSGFDTSATPVLRRMNMGANVAAFGATSLALSAAVETNGNGNSCGFRQLPAFEATKGSREVGLRQVQADGLVLQQVLGHYGRAAQ